jgi:hypothetical protein
MRFNIKPNFNIFIDDEVFFQNNSNFDEFLFHPFFEDVQELGIEKEDTKFFKQIYNYPKLVSSPDAARHLLSSVPEFNDWKSVVMKANTPTLIFTVIQLAFFLGKKQSKSSITFDVGYDKIYKNTITIIDGEIKSIISTFEDHSTYEKYVGTDNLISLEELVLIFKNLKEKTNCNVLQQKRVGYGTHQKPQYSTKTVGFVGVL